MNSDVLKFFIDLATKVVGLTDDIGLLNVAVAAFIAKTTWKSDSFMHFFKVGESGKGITTILNDIKTGAADASAGLNDIKTDATGTSAGLNDIKTSADGASTGFNTLGTAATASSVGVKLLNSALSMGISLLAGFIIKGVINFIDDLYISAEEAAEMIEKASKAIDSISSEFYENQQTVKGLAERFAELSQGVDMLTGKNLTLKTGDYEEFLDLSNQLADIFPTLSRNYDENGNAIVRLSGDTDTIVGSLENLLEVQRKIANQQILEEIPDLYDGIITKSRNYNKEIEQLRNERSTYESLLSDISTNSLNQDFIDSVFEGGGYVLKGPDIDSVNKVFSEYQDIFEKAGLELEIQSHLQGDYDPETGETIFGGYAIGIKDYEYYLEEEIDSAKEKILGNINIDNISADIQTKINENKANWSSLTSSIFSWLQTDSTYQILNDDMQSMVQTIINSLDFSKLDFDSWEDLQGYIKDNILSIFTNPDISNTVYESIVKMFDAQSLLQRNDINIGQYREQVLSFINAVENSGLSESIQEQLLQMFDIEPDVEDSIGKQFDSILNYVESLFIDKEFTLQTKDGKLNLERLPDLLNTLSYSDLQIINSDAFNVSPGTLSSWDELQAKIKETRNELTKDFTIDNFTEYAESITSVSTNISTLQEALEKLESGQFTLTDYVELIQQFPELAKGVDISSKEFKGLSKNLKQMIRNSPDDLVEELKQMREELEEAGKDTTYIDQLIDSIENMPTDAVKSLTNEYITLSDQINEATQAQNKLKEAMSENPNEGYETRGDAIEQMKTLMEEGKVGSESELWDIATVFFGDNPEALAAIANNDADALYRLIDARDEWYKTDKDGNYTIKGTESFVNDVEKVVKNNERLQELGVTWNYENGVLDFDFNNADWDEIVQILGESKELAGLTSEEFYDLLMQVGQFFNINWQDADDLIWFMDQINNESESVSENFDTAKNAVQSFLESSDISLDWLDKQIEDLDGNGIIDITETEEFKALPNDIQEVLTKYYELRQAFEEDPLGINWQLNRVTKDLGWAVGAEPIDEDTLEALSQVTTILKDNESDTVFIDYTNFRKMAKEAGYTEEAIDAMIEKIDAFGEIYGIVTSEQDPLGLLSLKDDAEKTAQYLSALQIEFEDIQNDDNTVSYKITVESVVDALIAQGWTAEEIQAYLTTLEQSGSYSFTIEGAEIELSTDDAQEQISDLIEGKEGLSNSETTDYVVTGPGEASVDRIKLMWDNIPSSKRTMYSVYENTYKKTHNPLENGTAHAQGTAYKSGSWGAQKSEDALVGELGPELRVRGNEWTLIGTNGAEFTDVRKGDVIFNHKQTEDLLKNGYVTGRGKAFAQGTAFASGSGLNKKYTFSDTSGSEVASKVSQAAKDISDASDEFSEVFDWIEVRLEEINESIDLQSARLENAVGSTNQNAIIDNLISLNQTLHSNLLAAASEYYAYAKELLEKIPEEYRVAAQNGSIAIEKFVGEVDEEILNAIQEYREWAQKGADVTQQAEETLAEISSLAKQAIDNIAADYENKISLQDIKTDQYDAYNDLLETDAGFKSTNIYQAIIDENNKNIPILQKQRDEMQAELNKRVKYGQIKKYSQDWYDAVNAIAEVDTQIIELRTDVEDYQDSINELHWDKFDDLMSRLKAVSDEAENLIDILNNKDLVNEDTSEWTEEGITSLGLYAQQMEAAEVQAKKYEEEIKYLNKNWKKLGYTEQEYIEKLNELKSGQYDAIKAYEDTKNAIVDLNKERVDAIKSGIEKEIQSYEKLISAKKKELETEKD